MSKGRTKVLLVAIKGEQLQMSLVARDKRGPAEYLASSLKQELPQHIAADIVIAGDDNDPTLYSSSLYGVLAPLVQLARQAGFLDVASMTEIGDEQIGPVLLRLKGEGRSVQLNIPAPPDLSNVKSLPALPHGLVPGWHGIRQASISALLRKTRADDEGRRWMKAWEAQRVLRQLRLPAPQRLPDALLEQSRYRAAWLTPLHDISNLDFERDDLAPLRLTGILHDGRLETRELTVSYDLQGLPEAIRADRPTERYVGYDRIYSCTLDETNPSYGELFVLSTGKELGALSEKIMGPARTVAREIYAELEPGLRDTFTSVSNYNLLQSGQDAERARKRRQMAESIWGGASLLLIGNKAGKALLDAVDSEEKLHAKAAKVAGVEPWVVKRMTRMPHDVLQHLAGWGGFVDVARELQHLGQHVQFRDHRDAVKYASLKQATKGLWSSGADYAQYLGVLGRTIARQGFGCPASMANHRNVAMALRDWAWFVDDCIDKACLPSNAFYMERIPEKRRRVRAELLADADLNDVLRWSAKFHELVSHVALASHGDQNAPPALFETMSLPSTGWTARQLRTHDELAREGREMDHCVQSYSGNVQARQSVIFSLASASGEDRITVELRAGQIRGWLLRQASHAHNDPVMPGTPARAALDEFLGCIEEQTPEIDAETMRKYRRPDAVINYGESFMTRLVNTYGTRAWTMVRGMLPGSAHGRIETKYAEIFWRVNARSVARCREDELRRRAAGRALDAMYF